MQRPVVAELVLQHPSRQISFIHKKEGARERDREREVVVGGSKLKIVCGGWERGWRWRRERKEAKKQLRATAKTR